MFMYKLVYIPIPILPIPIGIAQLTPLLLPHHQQVKVIIQSPQEGRWASTWPPTKMGFE